MENVTDSQMNVRFLIIATGYNCSQYTEKCFQSVMTQNYPKELYELVMYDDASTDGNREVLINLSKKHNNYICLSKKNRGAAYGRYLAVKEMNPDDETVIILLGMDDQLRTGALKRIAREYIQKKVWMTYGNWVDQRNRPLPANFNFYFDSITHQTRNYRKVSYRSTAPNTFKAFLFKAIPEDDFKIDGKWIDSTTESEVMFSCLEMCGEKRIGVILDKIYMYNRNLPNGTLQRLGKEYKYAILAKIKNRPKKDLMIRD
jgi:glycosyltransferase involved in cell wall biosynthesis